MKKLLGIAMALLIAGCASKYVPPEQRVINIDTQKEQACSCPPIPECKHRGMRWDSK